MTNEDIMETFILFMQLTEEEQKEAIEETKRIKEARKSPTPCGNTEQGSDNSQGRA